jgi:hypothetical protein
LRWQPFPTRPAHRPAAPLSAGAGRRCAPRSVGRQRRPTTPQSQLGDEYQGRVGDDDDMAGESPAYEPIELLGRLVGFRLYSVQFMTDFVQLYFDGPTQDMPILNCDAMPAVTISGQTFADGHPRYADALRSLISGTVVRTEEATGIGLRIELDNGRVGLHPAPAELVGPEIAMLHGFTDRHWMCWRPGEDSFEDLA